ncbi:MAG: DnaJ-class molecular chaperone CbpA [Candidatus Brocadiaceae bacterium]|nr:DnaJ-class molecular chaperone CbpA [Candidatus Brocadiaceae bacterium]
MEFKDYYQILGVADTASQEEIKRAYRQLALKYHPDVSKEAKADARFKEVSEAYEALGDKEKRVAYDRLLQSGYHQGDDFQPPPDWQTQTGFGDSGFSDEGRVDFSDFFSSIFGGGFKAESSRRRQNFYGSDNPAAADIYAEIILQLVDAYKGGEKRIAYQSPEVQQNGQVIMKKYTIDVSIPAGVVDGQHLRLKGLGREHGRSGEKGHLYLEIHIAPHPLYVLNGKNVTRKLPVTPWEAALGSTIDTSTLGGKVKLTIPPGSQSGTKLRLKGQGLPGNPAGDQFVILQLVNPVTLDQATEKLYHQLAEVSRFNPRALQEEA